MNDANVDIEAVHLDRELDDEVSRNLAAEIFSPETIKVSAKYAMELADIWLTVILSLATGVGTNAIWASTLAVAARGARFLERRTLARPERLKLAVVHKAEGLEFEIRFRAAEPLTKYHQAILLTSLDTSHLEDDVVRIVVDLVDQWARAFDAQGLLVQELPWPQVSKDE